MKKAKFNWIFPENGTLSEPFLELLQQEKIDRRIGQILWNRGIQSPEELAHFLHPSVDNLHDPFLLYDMKKAIERIQSAVENGEHILIYGDYDADGITSTTLMKEAIELIGGEVSYFLPNRFVHGYGPNLTVFDEKIAEGVQLIITVDNGIAGNEAINFAMQKGVDVIITDHHDLPPVLPEAFAIIHPKHPKGAYPFKELAGVGVAFKVATALLDEHPMECLDLVAIGTIADLVSLTGENRTLVKMGLETIRIGERIGLEKLIMLSDMQKEKISEENIAFLIAPRLNALGRLGEASPGVALLSTFDSDEALNLADYINKENEKRKEIVNQITQEAFSQIDYQDLVHVLVNENWHEGVLGIVASRIMQETGKPTLILTTTDEGQLAKGSGRSVSNLNMFEALNGMREQFTHFGGHHMAVGITLPLATVQELKMYLTNYINEQKIDVSNGQELNIDALLTIEEVDFPFIDHLKVLSPCGTENPAPTFLFQNVHATNIRQIGTEKNHLKCQLKAKTAAIDTIAFQMGDTIEELAQATVDVCGQLSINEWNGQKKCQLMMTDFLVKGIQFFDYRGKSALQKVLPNDETTIYIYFNENNKKFSQSKSTFSILFTTMQEILSHIEKENKQQLVFIDCPTDPNIIKKIVLESKIERVYFIGYSYEEAYVTGIGTRTQFAQLYAFVQQQQQLDVRYKLAAIAAHLKIQEKLLIFMIQVFLDVGFVTVENGVLKKIENPQKRVLEESKAFQHRLQQIKAEEFLLYSDKATLQNWLSLKEEEST